MAALRMSSTAVQLGRSAQGAYMIKALPNRMMPATQRMFATANAKPVEGQSSPNKHLTSSHTYKREWAWDHPVYSEEEVNGIKIAHREAKTWSDYIALGMVRLLRRGFDLATGYKHEPDIASGKVDPSAITEPKKYQMSEEEWLTRFIFLESIAGVPGMVGGMCRHLKSLRKLQNDGSWIESLLEEAENERIHLMTFLDIRKPSYFTRFMIVAGQGVFFNSFFLSYLISPRTCHRFVGFLEEEAVITYSRCLVDLDKGKLPEWSNMPAPEIAIDYWKLGSDATLRDVILAVRADESSHRLVNHTLANLKDGDLNPFINNDLEPTSLSHQVGFERAECIKS